ncbi:MAG: hypothetical protein IIV74_03295 [Alphaproteobacteria bacterium]|jgi:hypothetical protein|nr:hypothetical protein [Alphaproteobacteria bacterium]
MAKTNKKVSMGVMNLLKSVVDYKVKTLRIVADAGKRAADEETRVCEIISNLNDYIANARRYDAADAHEAEAELYDYESQAAAIRTKIIRGEKAKTQLQYADRFYKMYDDVKGKRKAVHVIAERAELEDKIAVLEKCMEACEINMTPGLYSADVAEQAKREYDLYVAECAILYKQLQNCR